MNKYFFIWLSLKRILKRPVFLFFLFLLPFISCMFYEAESNNSKICIGLCYNDELSEQVCKSLVNAQGPFKYVIYKDEHTINNDVQKKKIECGYIFDESFKDKMDSKKIDKSIKCIKSPSSILTNFTNEIIFSKFIALYGKDICVRFAENNSVYENITEGRKNLSEKYDEYKNPEKTFSINYEYENSGADDDSKEISVTYVMRGIAAISILIVGIYGGIICLEDRRTGLYNMVSEIDEIIMNIITIIVPVMMMSISALIVIYVSNNFTNLFKEVYGIISYMLCVVSLSYFLMIFLNNETNMAIAIPLLIIGTFIFCPVFIDCGKYLKICTAVGKFFITSYYFKVVYEGHYFTIIIISVILFVSAILKKQFKYHF